MAIEVQSADVIRVIVQFLRENNLNETAKCLQKESSVNLNYIEDKLDFASKVNSGRWDEVFEEISQLSLPPNVLSEIHEQIFNEMLEINELDAARALLRQGSILKQLKDSHLEKYLKLENLLSQTVLNGEIPSQLKESKKSRRARLVYMIFECVKDVPRSRLMSIISSALKWEEHCGNVSGNSSFDLLHGQIPAAESLNSVTSLDKFPKHCFKSVKLPHGSHAECAGFTPNGAFFVVGTADGFLEVWNPFEGTLRTDLPYQTGESDLMSMKGAAICCISFSPDSELFACGTIEGEVAVWRLSTGKLVKSFQNVHQNGITSVTFSPDQQSLLTTGFDNNIHILGMKSGRILKELRGHTSYVNCALWLDESMIISGSHDGSVKLWDLTKVECIASVIPKAEISLSPPPIKSICELLVSSDDTILLVTTQSSKLHLLSLAKRDFIQTLPTKLKENVHLVTSSLRNNFIFTLASDGQLLALKAAAGELCGSVKVFSVEPIGFALHPKLNILVTFDVSGEVKLWRSN